MHDQPDLPGGVASNKEIEMRGTSIAFTSLAVAAALTTSPGAAQGTPDTRAQVCTLGAAGVGQQATLICKDVRTGETTQSLRLSATVSAAGGIGGSLAARNGRVLVTNQAGGATLLRENHGWLNSPLALQIGGEGSLSGAVSEHGAYVLTGTRILFFPSGSSVASSSRPLLLADGSAAQVTVGDDFAYVSEKNGSLESFALAANGNLNGGGLGSFGNGSLQGGFGNGNLNGYGQGSGINGNGLSGNFGQNGSNGYVNGANGNLLLGPRTRRF